MDVAKHQVQVKDELIELTPKEFGILYQLMKEPEVVKKNAMTYSMKSGVMIILGKQTWLMYIFAPYVIN